MAFKMHRSMVSMTILDLCPQPAIEMELPPHRYHGLLIRNVHRLRTNLF